MRHALEDGCVGQVRAGLPDVGENDTQALALERRVVEDLENTPGKLVDMRVFGVDPRGFQERA